MRSIFCLLLACSLLTTGGLAQSVSFSLRPVLAAGDLENTGPLVLAINANGDAVSANGIAFTGLGFGFDPQSPPFDAQWTASGDDFFRGFASGPNTSASLDTLFANAFVANGTRQLTLSSLVPGEPYRLQLLIADDTIAARAFSVVVLGESFSFSRTTSDPAQALIAEFIAVGTSTDVTFIQAASSGSIVLNAFVLHQVPEPGAAALVALGALALLTRSRMARGAAVLLFLPAVGEAALTWEQTVQEFRCAATEEKVSGVFRFRNTGASPVTITSIRSSCGCTTAELAKRRYEPGEAGEVRAEFRFGGRKGTQEKSITVTTDEDAAASVNLLLRGQIEESLSVEPSLVFWRLGEAPAVRQIQLRAPAGRTLTISAVESSDHNFKPQVQPAQAGGSYLLTIAPASTAQRAQATVTITAVEQGGVTATFKAFAIVR